MALGIPLFLMCVAALIVIAIVVGIVLFVVFVLGAGTAAAGGAIGAYGKKDEQRKGARTVSKVLIAVGVTAMAGVIGTILFIVIRGVNEYKFSLDSMVSAAVSEDSYEDISGFLEKGEHPDSYYNILMGNYRADEGKETPLTKICGHYEGHKHYETAELLIESGADVNYEGREGTPLTLAYSQAHYKIAELLLENGADVNIADRYGRTPLMYALKHGVTEQIVKLVESGADVKAVDKSGKCVMEYAISHHNESEQVEMLLSKGADLNFDIDGKPVICAAAEVNGTKTLEVLYKYGADICASDKYGRNGMMYAAETRNCGEIIQWFAEKGADINARDNFGRTALMFFCKNSKGYTEEVKNSLFIFIRNYADINAADNNGRTPLMYLSENDINLEDIEWTLLERGADVNAADNNGKTPLMYFCENSVSGEETKVILIERGADVNACDKNGFTVLMYAAENKDYNAVKLLLENGADVNAVNSKGKTALDIAEETGNSIYSNTDKEQTIAILKEYAEK